jgi:hypothetical protein
MRSLLRRLWARFAAWIHLETWPVLRGGKARRFRLVIVTEEPDVLDASSLYAVGENGHLWHATFICPCGCGERISLNLMPDDSPRWDLKVPQGLPTLSPSVWRHVGCQSHFFIQRGTVIWCRPAAFTKVEARSVLSRSNPDP